MNNSLASYLRLQLDDSFLEKCFQKLDSKLERHEEMILELQRLLRNQNDPSALENLRESITSEFDSKLDKIIEKINKIDQKFDKKCQDLNVRISELEQMLKDRMSQIENSFDQKINDLEKRLLKEINDRIENRPDIHINIDEMNEKFQKMDNYLDSLNDITKKHERYMKSIVFSIGILKDKDTDLSLFDSDLHDNLNESTTFVNNELTNLHDELNRIKELIDSSNSELMEKLHDNENKVKDRNNQTMDNQQEIDPKIQLIKVRGMHGTASEPYQEFDFSSVKPYPSVTAHWRDPPNLPTVTQFQNMHDFVDYFYRLMPKLQAHLSAIQQKVVDNASDTIDKIDKNLVERMFDKFQNMLNELRNRLLELKDAVEQTATREEINEMLNNLLSDIGNDGQTAIGRVHCIACGREASCVTGARPEHELIRTIGEPSNSIAFRHSMNHTVGLQFGGRDGFDSEIIESPRSIRPYRPSAGKSKHRFPKLNR